MDEAVKLPAEQSHRRVAKRAGFMPSYFAIRLALVAIPGTGLALGLGLDLLRDRRAAWVYGACTVPVLIALLTEIAFHLRRGETGLDIVAALSMTAALASGQELAAIIVALMYSGGKYLENFAERRADREMRALLERVPRTAITSGQHP